MEDFSEILFVGAFSSIILMFAAFFVCVAYDTVRHRKIIRTIKDLLIILFGVSAGMVFVYFLGIIVLTFIK